jgi:hypothetical protein
MITSWYSTVGFVVSDVLSFLRHLISNIVRDCGVGSDSDEVGAVELPCPDLSSGPQMVC